MTSSLNALVQGLIDYAGLFPPAALDLPEVVQRYAAYRAGPHGWMLGRLIVPASELGAFDDALSADAKLANGQDAWHVSVIATAPFGEMVRRIWDFNGRHGIRGPGAAIIDAIEMKASTTAEVEEAADAVPAGFELFVEAPAMNAPVGLFEAAARAGASAKIRTGGTAPEQIPSPTAVATAITACHRAGLSFKATAGLHHPLRSERPLTYEPAPPLALMHGFLNVLIAAAAVSAGWVDEIGASEILVETSADAFRFTDASVAWRGHQLTLADLRAARRFFRSFGSCSFDEPIAGLEELALL